MTDKLNIVLVQAAARVSVLKLGVISRSAVPAMMRVVSRDVIEHLSQTRVISSERRYLSPGDIFNRRGDADQTRSEGSVT